MVTVNSEEVGVLPVPILPPKPGGPLGFSEAVCCLSCWLSAVQLWWLCELVWGHVFVTRSGCNGQALVTDMGY